MLGRGIADKFAHEIEDVEHELERELAELEDREADLAGRLEKHKMNDAERKKLVLELNDIKNHKHRRISEKTNKLVNGSGDSKLKKHTKERVKERAKMMNDDLRQENAVQYWSERFEGKPIIQMYLRGCYCGWYIASSSYFNEFIFLCIILAGLMVGVHEYQDMDKDPTVQWIDFIILVAFTLEVILKIVAEGLHPQWYFLGPSRYWNMFDLFIVLASLPFIPIKAALQGKGAALRLLRLLRLAKLFKRIPQLQMIVGGLVGGLKSIGYILLLLFMTFYIYAIAGILIFRDINPYHFRSIEVTFLTLLSTLTFDGWGDIFYTNYYGCEPYGVPMTGLYTDFDDYEGDQKILGGVMRCQTPGESSALVKVLCSFYFLSFIILASYSILAMFVGAVMMSMVDSMAAMYRSKLEASMAQRKKEIEKRIKILSDPYRTDRATKHTVRLIKLAFTGRSIEAVVNYTQNQKRILKKQKPADSNSMTSKLYHSMFGYYLTLVFYCGLLAENRHFNNFVTAVILIASADVGLSTDEELSAQLAPYTKVLGDIILGVFTFECAIKLIAEGETFWLYFQSNWNKFDFLIVVASYLPTGNGGMIMMLRLLRLLRVLKLLKAFPRLQVILVALGKGMSSIFYIGVILVIWIYVYAIIGKSFYETNDPFHFGTLHEAMASLFLVITLDAWSAMMNGNLYGGCIYRGEWDYPGDFGEDLCFNMTVFEATGEEELDMTTKINSVLPYISTNTNFVITSFYFSTFIIIGAYLILSLFIGVVGMSMEEANREQSEQAEIMEKVNQLKNKWGLDESDADFTINLYKEVFSMVDFTGTNKIGREEMTFGLKLAGNDLNKHEFRKLWRKVDRDDSNSIDFSEFLAFMFDLKAQRAPIKNERMKLRIKPDAKNKYSMLNLKDSKIAPVSDYDELDDDYPQSRLKRNDSVRSDSPDDFEFDNEETREEGDTPDRDENDASFNKILQNIRSQIDRLEKQKEEVLGGFPVWQNPSAGQYDWQGGYSGGFSASRPGTANMGPPGSPGSPNMGDYRPGSSFGGPFMGMGTPIMPAAMTPGLMPSPFAMPYGAAPAPFNFDPYTGQPVTSDQKQGMGMMMPGMLPGTMMPSPYVIPGAMYPGMHPQQMPNFGSPNAPISSPTNDERAYAIASNLTPITGNEIRETDTNDTDKKLKSSLCSV